MLIILINMLNINLDSRVPSSEMWLCSLVEVCWHFRGTYCLHLHGQRVSWGSLFCLITVCLLGLLSDPEDGDSILPQDVCNFYQASLHHIQADGTVHKVTVLSTSNLKNLVYSHIMFVLSLTVMLHRFLCQSGIIFILKNVSLLKLQSIKYCVTALNLKKLACNI
jgi:hypothetical protein